MANLGPPIFASEITSIVTPVDNITYYKLPDISDPDNDGWTMSVNLGEAIVFADFTNNSFTFEPMINSARIKPYLIFITLTDINSSPKKSVYTLEVTVPIPAKDTPDPDA